MKEMSTDLFYNYNCAGDSWICARSKSHSKLYLDYFNMNFIEGFIYLIERSVFKRQCKGQE